MRKEFKFYSSKKRFFGLFALKYSVYMYEIMDAKEEKL